MNRSNRRIAEVNIMQNQSRSFLCDMARSIDDAKPGSSSPMPLDRAMAVAPRCLSLGIASGENATKVTTTALQIAGAQGYRKDYLQIERCHRDARATQVMAPAPDIVKAFLGRLRLGSTLEQAIGLQ